MKKIKRIHYHGIKLTAVDFSIWNSYFDYDDTIKKSKERMSNNEQLKLIEENAKWIKNIRDEKSHPLNYTKYKERLEIA